MNFVKYYIVQTSSLELMFQDSVNVKTKRILFSALSDDLIWSRKKSHDVVTHFSDLIALSGKAAASASGELSIKKEQLTNALVPSMEITKSSPLVGGNAGK